MKKLICFVFLMVVSFSAFSDFSAGLAAANKGDFKTALQEWTPLAENNHLEAQYNVGALFFSGQGVKQDHEAAIRWFSKAAKNGHVQASYTLGYIPTSPFV